MDAPENSPPGIGAHLDTDPVKALRTLSKRFAVVRGQSRSRRHGHHPRAREHAFAYFLREVLGWSLEKIARELGRSVSNASRSVESGRRLVRSHSDDAGFSDPRRALAPELRETRNDDGDW
jgi:hypothetical protein